MPDPIRTKKGSVFAEAKMTMNEKEEIIKVNALVDADKYFSLTEEQKKAFLLKELQKVSPTPVSGIYNLNSSFNYVEKNTLKDFDYGNILVELHIPYCIDVPNGYEMEILISDNPKQTALIIPSKIWTQKAQTSDGERSDKTDFFADDRILYFKKSVILGPKVPLDPTEGWEQNYTGINIQKIKDRNGRFRFTHLFIQFDLPTKKEYFENKNTSDIEIEKVKDITYQIVNKLIDTYRFVTKKEYITRLNEININMIYFIDLDKGFYLSQVNTETSVMNRSKTEIEKMEKMLEEGQSPDLYNLLLLDAQNSFIIRNYPLAIVQSFQSLEIFIENFLIDKLQKNNHLTEQQAIDHLGTGDNWRTKRRLKEVLKEVTGFTVADKDKTLWDKWSTSYDTVRNEVIHKGKETNNTEVKNALENNSKIIELLKTL